MIESAAEFVLLRTSVDPAAHRQAGTEPAGLEVWRKIIRDHPEMRNRVAQNATVPLVILEELRHDADPRVRWMVRMMRSWARAHPDDSLRDASS